MKHPCCVFGLMLSALLQVSSTFALELVSPKEGEEFCALKPEHRAFLELDAEGRRAKLKDWTWRERIQKKDIASTPLPLVLAWRGGNGPYEVKVTLDGKTVADLPFGEAHRLTIRPAEGEENVLVLTGEAAYMESADCPGQDCVDMGPVTKDNMETRTMGGWIICLPHNVAVEVRER